MEQDNTTQHREPCHRVPDDQASRLLFTDPSRGVACGAAGRQDEVEPRADWMAIEREYVQSGNEPSTRELAEQYGVPHATVHKRCTRGGWAEKRSRFWREVSLEAEKKGIASQSEDLSHRNACLGQQWYELAQAALEDALSAERPSERQANTVSAGIATEKWRLVTGQTTAKAGSANQGVTDGLTEEECEELIDETIAAMQESRRHRQFRAGGPECSGADD